MDQTVGYAFVTIGILIPIVGGAALAYWITKTKHYVTIWWEGMGETRKRLKTIADHIIMQHPVNNVKMWIPLDGTMARTTAKGSLRYYVDGATGIPVQYINRPPGWLEMNGKRLGAIAKDMREQKIADASRAGKFDKLFEKMPLILGILGVMVLGTLIMGAVILNKVK